MHELATNLVKNVYGRIMPSKAEDIIPEGDPSTALSLEDLASKLDEMPNRDELVASFSLLQAELDRQNQITRAIIFVGVAVQLATLAGLAFLLLR